MLENDIHPKPKPRYTTLGVLTIWPGLRPARDGRPDGVIRSDGNGPTHSDQFDLWLGLVYPEMQIKDLLASFECVFRTKTIVDFGS
jgi:hypothetical protein